MKSLRWFSWLRLGSAPSIDFRHLDESHSLSDRVFPSQRKVFGWPAPASPLCILQDPSHHVLLGRFYDPLREKDILPSHQSREWERSGFKAQQPRSFSIPRITKEKSTACTFSSLGECVVLVCSILVEATGEDVPFLS